VPVPQAGSLAAFNAFLARADAADDARHIAGRPTTVRADFVREAPTLQPLPPEPFDTARLLSARVDAKPRVSVRQCFYSVPARLAGRRVAVRLGATAVVILAGGHAVATHERAFRRGAEVLPGALPGAKALALARAAGVFTATHDACWAEARRQLGDAAGTRALIEVLLAHRTLEAGALRTGMDQALRVGCVDPAVVVMRPDGPSAAAASSFRSTPSCATTDRCRP
jgi:hypothetical protein